MPNKVPGCRDWAEDALAAISLDKQLTSGSMVTGSRLYCCKERRTSDNIFRCAVKTVSSEPAWPAKAISKANATSAISVARASSVSDFTVAAICFGSVNSLCTLCCINIAQSRAAETSENSKFLSAQPRAISPAKACSFACSCSSTETLKQPKTFSCLPISARQTTVAVSLLM